MSQPLKAKGRPPLEPRISALEARMAEIEAKLGQPMPHGTPPDQFVMKDRYEPLFVKWPGNGS